MRPPRAEELFLMAAAAPRRLRAYVRLLAPERMTRTRVAPQAMYEPRLGARQVTCVVQPLYGDACGRQVTSSVMKRGKKKKSKRANWSRRSDCAVACTLDLIGDRWTLLIVRDLV